MKVSKKTKETRKAFAFKVTSICVNYGQPGTHFVPPSLGERGFFHCKKISK